MDREDSIVVENIKTGKGNNGYIAASDKYRDFAKAGIIDPAKVPRSSVQNAASVARLTLAAECLITDKPK